MSTTPYELSNVGGTWWAEGAMESGRKVRFDCGQGSRETAEGIAQEKWKTKLAASNASKKRWAKVAAGASSNGTAAAAPSSPKVSPERSAEIRGKLLAAGDAKPLDDDDQADDDDEDGETGDYIPPDGERDGDDDDDDEEEEEEGEDDEEAAEFLAEMLGNGAVTVVTGGVTKVLKRRKPPMRPGEPHEKFVDYARQGFTYRARKLVGKNSKLGPNGKLFVGLAGMIGMMLWNAEESPAADEQQPRRASEPRPQPQPAAAAPPAPAAAPPEPASNGTNGVPSKPIMQTRLAIVRTDAADDTDRPDGTPGLGKFS